MPVEATADGTVLKIVLAEGETADVFTPIAVVGDPGEDADAALAAAGAEVDVPAPVQEEAPAKAAKKEAEQEMILQFGGREIKEKDLYERIQQIWIEGYGKKAEELKSLKVYVKPEEFTAYYVINDDVTGSIDL